MLQCKENMYIYIYMGNEMLMKVIKDLINRVDDLDARMKKLEDLLNTYLEIILLNKSRSIYNEILLLKYIDE